MISLPSKYETFGVFNYFYRNNILRKANDHRWTEISHSQFELVQSRFGRADLVSVVSTWVVPTLFQSCRRREKNVFNYYFIETLHYEKQTTTNLPLWKDTEKNSRDNVPVTFWRFLVDIFSVDVRQKHRLAKKCENYAKFVNHSYP